MNVMLFLRTAALCVAAALIVFALYGGDLMFLIKGIALAIGFSIAFAIFYPQLRGIRKGDRVSVISNGFPAIFGVGRMGFALTDSAMNKEIRVKLDDGREVIGIVESYEGIFSPPRVRILYEEKLVE